MKANLKMTGPVLIIVAIVLITNITTHTAPPHPELLSEIQAGQREIPYYLEHIDELHDKGVCVPEQTSIRIWGPPEEITDSVPPFRVLALLVKFSDNNSSVPAIFFDSLVFNTIGSTVHDYFAEMSDARIDLVTFHLPSTIGWTMAPQRYSYYVDGENGLGSYPRNSQKLVEDLVDVMDPLMDFSVYDNDLNGFVDVLIVIHSGSGAEITGNNNQIWSHKWAISPRLKDGVFISSYTMQPEYWYSQGDMTIGVYVHELFHGFGLPDLYDTDQSSYGIGRWGVMGYGCWNGPGSLGSSPSYPCAWSRIEMKLEQSTNVTGILENVLLQDIKDGGQVYRLWRCGQTESEYFLLENRRKSGYDSFLPNEGLLIWHVDDDKFSNNQEWYPQGYAPNHYLVALEQADGLFELEHRIDQGDAADPFPGSLSKTVFDHNSAPNSNSYTNGPTYVRVYNIDTSGPNINLDMTVGLYGCCCGIHGDANGDGQEGDMIDLTFIVDYVFRFSGNSGTCFNESDINADGIGPNILDLTYLVDRIFRGGPQMPLCS